MSNLVKRTWTYKKENYTRYRIKRKELERSLKNVPCTDCGIRFPAVAMDFDHVTGTKEFDICKSVVASKERLLLEVKKCEVVCANCHRIRTAARKGDEKGIRRPTGFDLNF